MLHGARPPSTAPEARRAGIDEIGAVDHAADAGPIGSSLAHRTRARGGVDRASREIAPAEAACRIANGLHLGMRGRVAPGDDAAGRLADDTLVVNDDPERWSQYVSLRAPLSNRRAEVAALRLLGDATTRAELLGIVAAQQGLLQVYEDFCLQDATDCARCRFPEQLAKW